jgi:nitrogen fixation/metabolism regulation signal transduction histidine kinase
MMESGSPTVEQTDPPLVFRRAWFRRRQYLIDRKGQLLTTAKVAGVVLVLLVLVNLVFGLWSQMETETIVASHPELVGQMADIDRRATQTLAVLSFIVLALVVVRSIRLTHRTAGAAFNLQRCLESVASGNYDTELRVRRKDNLRHLQGPFNRMTESLRRRSAEDYAVLLDLTERLEELGLSELAEEVRQLAEAKEMVADPID